MSKILTFILLVTLSFIPAIIVFELKKAPYHNSYREVMDFCGKVDGNIVIWNKWPGGCGEQECYFLTCTQKHE